jgi:hypothetical protein
MFDENDLDLGTSGESQTGSVTDNLGGTSGNEQTSQDPKPYEIPDDALVSVKVDGQDKLLPWREARSGVMFQSAFTKRTQELADQRKQFESERTQILSRQQEYDTRLTQLQQVLSNPQSLAALYMHVAGNQQQPQQPQPLTTEYLPKLEQNFEQKMAQSLEKMRTQFSQERQAERYEQEMDSFLGGVLQQHPALRVVDGIADVIYDRVAKLGPKSIEEAKELARTMAEGMSRAQREALDNQAKADALAKARAENGIEPRGGMPVFQKPASVNKLEDMDNAFLAYLQQQGAANR